MYIIPCAEYIKVCVNVSKCAGEILRTSAQRAYYEIFLYLFLSIAIVKCVKLHLISPGRWYMPGNINHSVYPYRKKVINMANIDILILFIGRNVKRLPFRIIHTHKRAVLCICSRRDVCIVSYRAALYNICAMCLRS